MGSPFPRQSISFDVLSTRILHAAFVISLWFCRGYTHGTKYIKKILGIFTCFKCVHLRLSWCYMLSLAQWSSQGCFVNLICGLGKCSSCCNFTCCREYASYRESDGLVVYETDMCGFVWMSSLYLLLPAFLTASGVCQWDSGLQSTMLLQTWDSHRWHLGANCSWTSEQECWGSQHKHSWAKPYAVLFRPLQRAGMGLWACSSVWYLRHFSWGSSCVLPADPGW